MKTTRRTSCGSALGNCAGILICLVAAASLGAWSSAGAANVTIDLCATTGTTTLPDTTTVPVWGYVAADCVGAPTVTQPGGPVLDVNVGDVVTVQLHNNLSVDTGILFAGQTMVPDTIGVAGGGTKTYSFTASRPGSYLYQAGLLPGAQHQVAMGLYGALIVRPASANQAYNDPNTAFDAEAVLVLSEIDPALNNRANPATFDLRNYKPRYFLINGLAYPDTDPIAVAAADRVLLRYVNAGVNVHSMTLLGLNQTVIAYDGKPLTHSHRVAAESYGPGQSTDAVAQVPAGTDDGSQFALYDAGLLALRNSAAGGFGGMLTLLTVSATGTSDDLVGPVASNLAYAGGTLTATIDDTTTGGSTVGAAEYSIDTLASAGSGSPMSAVDLAFDATTEDVTALVAITAGPHTLYVRGQDSAGNWGVVSSLLVDGGDATGPTTTALTLSPNPANGTSSVALTATANDSASGGSNIDAAEYTIDGGAAVPMAVNVVAPIASVSATLSTATINALVEGAHVIALRSHDEAGNWGGPVNIGLIVDRTGPTTSAVSATPNPFIGAPFDPGTSTGVRVSAAFEGLGVGTCPAEPCAGAEGFIDTVGTPGTGFPFVADDGVFNQVNESGYADIPEATVNLLSNGNHTLFVRARDTAGNWGATASVSLNVNIGGSAVPLLYFSTAGDVAVPFTGGQPDNADIYQWDGVNFARVFDATAHGVPAAANLDALQVVDADTFYMSFAAPVNLPGLGNVDDSDIVLYDAGSWTLYFDGSDVGLTQNGEDIDAFAILSDGSVVLSTEGFSNIPNFGGVADEDMVRCSGSFGPTTSCTWSRYFDGTDVGFGGAQAGSEDVDGASVSSDGSIIYLSSVGNFSVAGVSGQAPDVFTCNAPTTGATTVCNSFTLFFDGSAHRLWNNVDAIDVH